MCECDVSVRQGYLVEVPRSVLGQSGTAVCMYIFVCVLLCVCTCLFVYSCVYVHLCVCTVVCMYSCVYVRPSVCVRLCVCKAISLRTPLRQSCLSHHMCMSTCVCSHAHVLPCFEDWYYTFAHSILPPYKCDLRGSCSPLYSITTKSFLTPILIAYVCVLVHVRLCLCTRARTDRRSRTQTYTHIRRLTGLIMSSAS
jgi:hypothetical protein